MAAVYRDEPALATVEGFTESLGHMICTYLTGLLAKATDDAGRGATKPA
jgi:hypothetical protein